MYRLILSCIYEVSLDTFVSNTIEKIWKLRTCDDELFCILWTDAFYRTGTALTDIHKIVIRNLATH